MNEISSCISSNPAAFASLLSAIISASVAFTVAVIAQYLGKKKDRTQFLSTKFEELYLLLNEIAESNTRIYKLTDSAMRGSPQSKKELIALSDSELYGHVRAKKIVMYVRVYFPKLTKIHVKLFSTEQMLNGLLYALATDLPIKGEDLIRSHLKVGRLLMLMESEMINNRAYLTKDFYFFGRYKNTTDDELNMELDIPEVFQAVLKK